jgi:hypothetical protein
MLEPGQQSGTRRSGESDPNAASIAPRADSNNRPGGGLGPPIDAPDPLQKYRWWILGGSAAVLLIGGVYVASRQQPKARALMRQKDNSSLVSPTHEAGNSQPVEGGIWETARAQGAARPTMLMDGIKEELFQIEVERKQGQISRAEYEKVKAALDQTLDRALRREAQKSLGC